MEESMKVYRDRQPHHSVRRGMSMAAAAILAAASAGVSGCGHAARLPVSAGIGPNPSLTEPRKSLIPLVNVAKAVGWAPGEKPTPAPGLAVTAYATGLDHPRWLYVLPNGDVLVSETNAPDRPEDSKGIRAFFMGIFMKKAGAAVPSANRITLLRDADHDGIAETRYAFREGLVSPFGIALADGKLYIADTDAVLRLPYETGMTRLTGNPETVTQLPAGERNHHWTKNVVASQDGRKLYVSVGSNSNVAENGMAAEKERAAIWEVDIATGDHRIYASGLRNPVGMAWEPETRELWVSVNERDELGSDLVPDYMTSVRDGGFYGWPYSYYGQHVDTRVEPQRLDLVAKAIVPDYALGPHTASLGLASAAPFADNGAYAPLSAQFASGMYVGQHGSWNRKPRSGYRVIFVPFVKGRPSGEPVEVLAGFLDEDGHARGRPVGVAPDGSGGLLVADDVGNVVWRVTSVPARGGKLHQ
jgi:glucose/arabinose dehydrogenase